MGAGGLPRSAKEYKSAQAVQHQVSKQLEPTERYGIQGFAQELRVLVFWGFLRLASDKTRDVKRPQGRSFLASTAPRLALTRTETNKSLQSNGPWPRWAERSVCNFAAISHIYIYIYSTKLDRHKCRLPLSRVSASNQNTNPDGQSHGKDSPSRLQAGCSHHWYQGLFSLLINAALPAHTRRLVRGGCRSPPPKSSKMAFILSWAAAHRRSGPGESTKAAGSNEGRVLQ